MINQITCNSNNTIQLSRAELLQWLNGLLNINYTRIEQLGTGAAYCQLLDLIYPGKVPISKVNWKAKTQYQYINNFKVLQQCFSKLHILRYVEVEKLIKCKCQDNLEFLQWFKKIFDNICNGNPKESHAVTSRTEKSTDSADRGQNECQQNRNYQTGPIPDTISSCHTQSFESIPDREKLKLSPASFLYSSGNEDGNDGVVQRMNFKSRTDKIDGYLLELASMGQDQQKQFYLNKIKQIEHLMEGWSEDRSSGDLIESITKIISLAQDVQWKVENGQIIINQPSKTECTLEIQQH